MQKKIPGYVWTFAALIGGILLGGLLPETLNPVAVGTRAFINFIIKVVPILIFCALSPAIATLVKRGLAGKFGGSVILWYVASSTLAGLLGVVFSSLLFRIPFSSEEYLHFLFYSFNQIRTDGLLSQQINLDA